MAIDKNKIELGALKLAQKGQFGKALAEYQKILVADPKDIRTRLKLFELYGRLGKKDNAIEECKRISDTYVEQGFLLRAIAVWKQALRIDPANPDLYRSMGELYLQQKLVGDAIAAFKRAVELLRERNRLAEAGKLLAKMEEMAPENVAIKMHLAELYLDDHRFDDFKTELEKIILQLKGEGRARKLLHALEALYQKSGCRPEMVRPLAELYVELGEDEKALEVMKVGLSANPQDRDLRLNCIRANLSLGNLVDARKIALSIREEDPADLNILEQLAAISQARGDRDELAHWYKEIALVYRRLNLTGQEEAYFKKVLELTPDDAEAMLALGGMEAVVVETSEGAADTETIETTGGFFLDLSSEILGESPVSARDSAAELREGLVEAELYIKYGLDEKAFAKLSSLADLAPSNVEVRQKLRDICWRRGDREGWVREQYSIAKMFLSSSRLKEAHRIYEAILEVAPHEVEARQSIAELVGEEEAAYAVPGDGLVVVRDVRESLREADSLIIRGDTGEAISLLLRLQESNPTEEGVRMRLTNLGWVAGEEELSGGEDFSGLKAEFGDLEFDVASSIAGFEDVEVSELDDIVKEFRSGVAEKLDDSDYTTHYDLGVAYKEMGLFEDALHEFQKAARYTEKAKQSYTSMAMIYREIGRHSDARSALRLALAVPTNTGEDRAAILYELGVLAEDERDWEGAVSAFEKVAAINPGLREVGAKLQTAKANLGV